MDNGCSLGKIALYYYEARRSSNEEKREGKKIGEKQSENSEQLANHSQRKSKYRLTLWRKLRKKILKVFSHHMNFNNKRCYQLSLIQSMNKEVSWIVSSVQTLNHLNRMILSEVKTSEIHHLFHQREKEKPKLFLYDYFLISEYFF